jgi:hypothetical protein
LFALVVALAALAAPVRAQLPPLPLPLPTTTTSSPPEDAAPPDDTLPPSSDTTVDTLPTPAPIDVGVAPVVSVPPPTAAPGHGRPATTKADRRPPASQVDLAGSFGVGAGGVLLVALVLVSLASQARPGGLRMSDPRRRWRLFAALGSLTLAAVIGVVGWLKLSLEPQVNHQLPYLASAGMALVLLATVGGSLLVAEQLRSDDQRIADLEDAVRRLATTLEPMIESAPRGR